MELFNLIPTSFNQGIQGLLKRLEELGDSKGADKNGIPEDSNIKLNQIIFEFENLNPGLKLKIIPMDTILFFINTIQEHYLLKFLLDLTLDDLRDIVNSIAGSSFDINDIENYQSIKVIINITTKFIHV